MGRINIIAFNPPSNDGAALGTTALQWSDLFLASGGVINWANGNVTLTHASALLTMAGGDFLLNRSSATAFQVGPNGATGPTLVVATNISSGATGLSITNAASGSGVTLAALGGTNENIIATPKGTGLFKVNGNILGNYGGNAAENVLIGDVSANGGFPGFWFGSAAASPSYSNYSFLYDSGTAVFNAASGHTIDFRINNGTIGQFISTFELKLKSLVVNLGGVTAGQTVFVQDTTASTGQTKMILKGGAVAGTIFEVQDSAAGVKTTLTDAGLLKSISIYASGDGSGLASTTGLTNVTNTTLTNAYVVNGGQAATTSNTGWIKVYVGTVVSWIPYWSNATP